MIVSVTTGDGAHTMHLYYAWYDHAEKVWRGIVSYEGKYHEGGDYYCKVTGQSMVNGMYRLAGRASEEEIAFYRTQMWVQEIQASVQEMSVSIKKDIARRIKMFQEGCRETVVLDVTRLLEYPDNDAAFYIKFLSYVDQLPGSQWQDPFGAWSDLPDTMLDDLDQMRRENPPTPPIEMEEEE